MSLLLASPSIREGDVRLTTSAALLLGYTIFRSFRPLRYGDDLKSVVLVLLEAAGTILGLVATGYWDSPLVLSSVTVAAVAGFARGFGFGIRVAVCVAVAVSLPWSLEDAFRTEDRRTLAQWSVEVFLVAVVAGYARRISGEADRRQSLALDRLGRLSDANTLLFQLHEVTQSLPASLDLEEVLDNTMVQLAELFDYDSLALLLFDETDGCWHTTRRDGWRPPSRMTTDALAPPLLRAISSRSVVTESTLLASGGPGLAGSSGSGLYAPLVTRGSTIGVLSMEHNAPHHFRLRDADLLGGFVESAALAIDNGRWFSRLRTVGADEERTRIARDLHDRIGQSLAYLAFELDRIVRTSGNDRAITPHLDQLRSDVRGVIREVRDTLYDLRTDVSEAHPLPETLQGFLDRVRERSGLRVGLRSQETARIPILQEREMWRIAQEAVTNVERHARADQVTVTWRSDGIRASLEIADDGAGFEIGTAGRLDSYGMMGMRERAASIGATLTVDSELGKGTRIRCALDNT